MQILANKRTVMSVYCGIKTALMSGSLGLFLMGNPAVSEAKYYTADDVMKIMNDEQRYYYISGVISGLETARYVKDGNDTGSACINRWFYDAKDSVEKIYAAFTRFGDKLPSAILYALVSKECGK